MQKSLDCQAEISHKDVTLTSANVHISLALPLVRELHRCIFAVWVLRRKGPESTGTTSNWDNTLVVVVKKIFINRKKYLNLEAVATESEGMLGNGPLFDVCVWRTFVFSGPTPTSGQESGPFKRVPEPSRKLIQWPLTPLKKKFSVIWSLHFGLNDSF